MNLKNNQLLKKLKSRPLISIGGGVLFVGILVFGLILISASREVSAGDAIGCATKVNKSVTVQALQSDPNSYKGECVTITGKVFKAETGTFQMWSSPEQSQGNVIVGYSGQPSLTGDEYVKVTGVVKGEYTGTNAFGAELSAPTVLAESVAVVDRSIVISPTTAKNDTPQVKEQSGYSVTLTRVEFAENETRAYITVKNNSADKASLYTFNSKLVQAGTQIKQKNVFDDKKNELPSELAAGAGASGIVYFEAANPTQPSSLVLEAYLMAGYSSLNFSFDIAPAH